VEPNGEFAPLFEMVDASDVEDNGTVGSVSILAPGEHIAEAVKWRRT
jgi:hypothetical protein